MLHSALLLTSATTNFASAWFDAPTESGIDYNAISALATLAAVLVALFLDPVRTWWRSPKLRLGIRMRDASRQRIDSGLEAVVRFYVYNDGRGIAKQLRLTLTSIFVRNADRFEIFDQPIATDLAWSG